MFRPKMQSQTSEKLSVEKKSGQTKQSSSQEKSGQTKPSSGDEQLDKLVANGTIQQLKTCCGNGVYNDHELNIVLEDGTRLFSSSTLTNKFLEIRKGNQIYRRTNDTSNNLLSLLSIFNSAHKDEPTPPKKFSYTEMSIGSDGKDNYDSLKTISEDEFTTVFKALPAEVQNVMNRRETNNVGNIQVIFSPSSSSSTSSSSSQP